MYLVQIKEFLQHVCDAMHEMVFSYMYIMAAAEIDPSCPLQ